MLKDEISKSATLILVGAYGIMLLDIVVVAVVRAHIILIIMSVRIIVEAKWVQQLKLENAFSWLNYNLYALYILWDKPCKVEFTINIGFNHWRCFKDKSDFRQFILHNIYHQIISFIVVSLNSVNAVWWLWIILKWMY